MKMRRLLALMSGALIVAAAAFGVAAWLTRDEATGPSESSAEESGFADRFAGYVPASEPNGNLARVVWPEFVTAAGPEVRRLYEFQIENGDLMRYMPCFCGCGEEAGHRSNRDCYVRRVTPDGTVVLDPMAPT